MLIIIKIFWIQLKIERKTISTTHKKNRVEIHLLMFNADG